jgi:hypothetical protein
MKPTSSTGRLLALSAAVLVGLGGLSNRPRGAVLGVWPVRSRTRPPYASHPLPAKATRGETAQQPPPTAMIRMMPL